MKQVRDVLQLHSVMDLSLRKIQGATNVAKSTIADYIKLHSSNNYMSPVDFENQLLQNVKGA